MLVMVKVKLVAAYAFLLKLVLIKSYYKTVTDLSSFNLLLKLSSIKNFHYVVYALPCPPKILMN